ncbi:F-box/kelch-repeat protein At3g24760 [Andrographis paniculata]|uniref:F-box/kelch-repeat protein At3g24760 n=1 Tax=Andrographis paniculata TaxID=175694 RepID=UPI0021E6E430|nr:F-box/kelch-repeat protein At3g24760 [Andrographis paniculata]
MNNIPNSITVPPPPQPQPPAPSGWDILGPDLTELILSHLSDIPAVLRSAAVCKQWNSIIHSHSFKTLFSRRRRRWLFLSDDNHAACAFDPDSDRWITLPSPIAPSNFPAKLDPPFSMRHRVMETYTEPGCPNTVRIILAGGGDDGLAAEIYTAEFNSSEKLAPLPGIFRPANGTLSSAIHNQKFYVLISRQGFLSSFDFRTRRWSAVRTVKPAGAVMTRLISGDQDRLILAGLCCLNGAMEFNLWRIDEESLEYREIAAMPEESVSELLIRKDSIWGEERLRFAGGRNVVYAMETVRGEICEIRWRPGKWCRWRKIPRFPVDEGIFRGVSRFYCSGVSLKDFLTSKEKTWLIDNINVVVGFS